MFQQIIILGNLGQDPEMRYTPSGVPVTSFSIATNRRWTGQDGQPQEKTVWFRVTAWQKQAEFASQYLTKGRQVMVIGEMEEARPWTDKDGNNRASLEVRARTIQFVGGRGDTEMGGGYGGGQSGGTQGGGEQGSAPAGGDGPSDEDIPF
jgi:single-strand DNA-binding protein